jgi:hypothetical protein
MGPAPICLKISARIALRDTYMGYMVIGVEGLR